MNLNEKIQEMIQKKKKELVEIEKLEPEAKRVFLEQIKKNDIYENFYNLTKLVAQYNAKLEIRLNRAEKLLLVHNATLLAGLIYYFFFRRA